MTKQVELPGAPILPDPDPHRYFEPETELMSRADLRALQEQKTLELVPYVYERSALYRTVWDKAGVHPRDIHSMDDFRERIPVITKDTIRWFRDTYGDPFGGLLCVEPDELTAIMSSSGTTGDPTYFPERFSRWSPMQTSYVRDLWEHGLRPGDHVVGTSGAFRGGGLPEFRLLGCTALALNAWMGGWEELLDAIEKYDVSAISLIGPVMGELERIAQHRDLTKTFASLKFATFAGEPLGSRMKATVQKEWGVRLVMWSSAGDTGTAWECREHDGYHLWEDTVVPESLDPVTRAAVPDNEVGELVVTDIDNLVAPLVRFGAEDLVRSSSEQCRCGRHHSRIWPLGRSGDVTVVQGRSVMPVEVWSAIEQHDETRAAVFQIVRPQREVDELQIRVGYNHARTTSLDELRERLAASVESHVGVSPIIELIEEGDLLARSTSAAKIPRIVKA
jgi:phenylacetate-CoA ligase